MKLGTIIIHVPDVATLDKCRDWYQALGLQREPLDQPGESYWFDLSNGVLLGIHTGKDSPAGFAIYLDVPDVDEAYRTLNAQGFRFETAPETKFWGRSAQLKDPAGTSIVLVSPAEPDRVLNV